MTRRVRTLVLGRAQVLVRHRPHPTVTAPTRQVQAVGLRLGTGWPGMPPTGPAADFIFFDADMDFDAQRARAADVVARLVPDRNAATVHHRRKGGSR